MYQTQHAFSFRLACTSHTTRETKIGRCVLSTMLGCSHLQAVLQCSSYFPCYPLLHSDSQAFVLPAIGVFKNALTVHLLLRLKLDQFEQNPNSRSTASE